jgi:hypothetical protein
MTQWQWGWAAILVCCVLALIYISGLGERMKKRRPWPPR